MAASRVGSEGRADKFLSTPAESQQFRGLPGSRRGLWEEGGGPETSLGHYSSVLSGTAVTSRQNDFLNGCSRLTTRPRLGNSWSISCTDQQFHGRATLPGSGPAYGLPIPFGRPLDLLTPA